MVDRRVRKCTLQAGVQQEELRYTGLRGALPTWPSSQRVLEAGLFIKKISNRMGSV